MDKPFSKEYWTTGGSGGNIALFRYNTNIPIIIDSGYYRKLRHAAYRKPKLWLSAVCRAVIDAYLLVLKQVLNLWAFVSFIGVIAYASGKLDLAYLTPQAAHRFLGLAGLITVMYGISIIFGRSFAGTSDPFDEEIIRMLRAQHDFPVGNGRLVIDQDGRVTFENTSALATGFPAQTAIGTAGASSSVRGQPAGTAVPAAPSHD